MHANGNDEAQADMRGVHLNARARAENGKEREHRQEQRDHPDLSAALEIGGEAFHGVHCGGRVLELANGLFELLSAVLVVLEEVKAGATG